MDNYCKHGTYVGGPLGPDFMCGWCEEGVSDIDYANYVHNELMRDWANDVVGYLFGDLSIDWNNPIVADDIQSISRILHTARNAPN